MTNDITAMIKWEGKKLSTIRQHRKFHKEKDNGTKAACTAHSLQMTAMKLSA